MKLVFIIYKVIILFLFYNLPERPNLHPTSDNVAKFYQHPIDVNFLNYKDRKRILITGGSGFVGSHLTDR